MRRNLVRQELSARGSGAAGKVLRGAMRDAEWSQGEHSPGGLEYHVTNFIKTLFGGHLRYCPHTKCMGPILISIFPIQFFSQK